MRSIWEFSQISSVSEATWSWIVFLPDFVMRWESRLQSCGYSACQNTVQWVLIGFLYYCFKHLGFLEWVFQWISGSLVVVVLTCIVRCLGWILYWLQRGSYTRSILQVWSRNALVKKRQNGNSFEMSRKVFENRIGHVCVHLKPLEAANTILQ